MIMNGKIPPNNHPLPEMIIKEIIPTRGQKTHKMENLIAQLVMWVMPTQPRMQLFMFCTLINGVEKTDTDDKSV